MHTSLFLTIILSLQKSHPTPAYGLDTTEWRDDGTAPKNAKPRIKNKLSQTPRPLTHKLARDTTQYILNEIWVFTYITTSTNININTTSTQH